MNKEFNKGLLLAGFGSFWWGFFGVIYFKYIAYIGHIELVVHRCLWTTIFLLITTFFLFKWQKFLIILKSSKKTELNFFHFDKMIVVKISITVVHALRCRTTSMWPAKAIYLKYITPIKPHQKEPNAVKIIPLLN